jgi:pyrimidine-nucleoside phosphorylase
LAFIQAYRGHGGSGLSPHVGPGLPASPFGALTEPSIAGADAVADPGAIAVADADADADAVADTVAVAIAVAGADPVGSSPGAIPDDPSSHPAPVPSRSSTAITTLRVIDRTIATPRPAVVWLRPMASATSTVPGTVPARTLVELVAAKRDGQKLPAGDIARLVAALGSGELADYQMAAWLMAVYFRGLDDEETVALTDAMLSSGRVLDLSSVPGFKVDKHSTGGVGDKVSIALAPLVAACGVPVPMVSGRGLGHTGGTLDKLEAIPGFSTQLAAEDFTRIVRDVGCCMIGQTAEIAPADKRIYALRDVTATVECIPLIVASILSKKLAEGIDGLVLDVKVGRGAFMKTEKDARALAEALVRVGTRAGKRVVALLTDMESPLGIAVGNAVETREALDLLAGEGPADLVECTLCLAAEMLVLGGVAQGDRDARSRLASAIGSGAAAATAERMIQAQGGDPRVVADRSRLAVAPVEVVIPSPRAGIVATVDALGIGLAAVAMGAGRTRADQPVDPTVGILVDVKPGARVERGQPLARLRVRDARDADTIAPRVASAFSVGDASPPRRPMVIGRIGGSGEE